MAKGGREKIKLESTAGTGHFYTTDKNKKTTPEKMLITKFDPKARKHAEYKESTLQQIGLISATLCVAQENPLHHSGFFYACPYLVLSLMPQLTGNHSIGKGCGRQPWIRYRFRGPLLLARALACPPQTSGQPQ